MGCLMSAGLREDAYPLNDGVMFRHILNAIIIIGREM